ncbi:MAG TPA: KTSC domain-containing protein, partial [Ignavibacteriaceae bacterium]
MKTFQNKVDSSAISSYEYDDETLELDVKFKSGIEYRYYDVDEATFEKLQLAESKGNFIATEIKKFEFEKLGSV